MKLLPLLLLGAFALGGCGSDEAATEETVEEINPCAPRDGDIRSMSDLVFFLNELDKPLSLNCAVNALPNGFQLNATASKISVQPAHDRFQSRFFLAYGDDIYLSIVPGEMHLEIGEVYNETLSIKGEITFPLEEEISLALPYRNVSDEIVGRKKCGAICHSQSIEVDSVGGVSVYASTMIRPNPTENVSLEELKTYFQEECSQSSEICEDYEAIFDHQDIEEYSFPRHIPFF